MAKQRPTRQRGFCESPPKVFANQTPSTFAKIHYAVLLVRGGPVFVAAPA